jgi:fused signal recognition particle receptor
MFGLKKKSTPGQSGVLGRLRSGLQKTRALLFADVDELFRGQAIINQDLLEEIESRLLMADLGIESTSIIIEALGNALKRNELNDMAQLTAILQEQMQLLLEPVQQPLEIPAQQPKPQVILVVGVNGAGKTTTIAKLGHYYKTLGHKVMLAAGDTFRAAAIEQLQSWGQTTGIPVIAQHSGADAAAVIYDALHSAQANNMDLLIADTAGRLHNKENLMEELGKIRRTITKFNPELPVEVMLILDAGTGQNALAQAAQFNQLLTVTGITLTKLDGTAKGGVVFALARKLCIPVRFIGLGEQQDDLRPFEAEAFIQALLDFRS